MVINQLQLHNFTKQIHPFLDSSNAAQRSWGKPIDKENNNKELTLNMVAKATAVTLTHHLPEWHTKGMSSE